MSVTDDAREVAENRLQMMTITGTMVCVFCSRSTCRPNCVRHALPKIVAALEAAKMVTIAYEEARIIFGAPMGYRFKAAIEKFDEALDE